MTKVDSQKPREGPPKSSMGSWCNSLQPLVIQPCSTEWPEWPPGATVTVTKLNVSVSLLQFSVVFLAHLLSFSSFSTADIWTHNEISTKVTTEAFSKGLFFFLSDNNNIVSESTPASSFCTNQSLCSLPSSPAGTVVLSFSLLTPPHVCFFSFNLLWIDF